MKAIVTTYHGPTLHKPARVSADDGDGNRLSISYDDSLDREQNHWAACSELCLKMRWHGKLQSGEQLRGGRVVCVVWVWVQLEHTVGIV
jgi:hypothetical protein